MSEEEYRQDETGEPVTDSLQEEPTNPQNVEPSGTPDVLDEATLATTPIQRISAVGEENIPNFPHSRKGGYVVEAVDEWVSGFLSDMQEIINYQNTGVDVADAAQNQLNIVHGELDVARADHASTHAAYEAEAARAAELENTVQALTNRVREAEEAMGAAVRETQEEFQDAQKAAAEAARVAALEAEVTNLRLRNEELEAALADAANTPAVAEEEPAAVAAPISNEAATATALLQQATEVADRHVADAKVEAELIVEEARESVATLTVQKAELETQVSDVKTSLRNFLSDELARLTEADKA